ncbi:MAG: hypothetical protein WCR98_02060 [Saccharofermentanales bacterium]
MSYDLTFQMTLRRAVTRIVMPEKTIQGEKVQEELEVQEELKSHEDYKESDKFTDIEGTDNADNETLSGSSGD